MRIFDASIRSVFLYGCESWIVTDPKLVGKINALATSYYRKIFGLSLLDKIPNESILTIVKRKPLINFVRKLQLGWLGHVQRRDERAS